MQKYRGTTLIALLAVGLFASFLDRAFAQVYSGSITGTVTDATGGVIPNATATLTDQNKGFNFKATSGSDGRYILRNLPPGVYKLVVSAPGMRNFTSARISIWRSGRTPKPTSIWMSEEPRRPLR